MLDIMEEFGGIVWWWLQYSQLLLAMGYYESLIASCCWLVMIQF
jgi:hypothetical protein